MAQEYVIDTHALLRYLADLPTLGAEVRRIMDDKKSGFAVPAIVLAESLWLLRARRFEISEAQFKSALMQDTRFHFIPLTPEIVFRAFELVPEFEMHDRLIVATTLHLRSFAGPIALLTKDQQIVSSGLVHTIWD